jgi:predicted transcriptional regulator
MKSVLISIQPKWCELIASGVKTVEVRKTKPKLEMPFKVYIYETQGRTETPFVDEEGHHIFKGRGRVIGEFICDNIIDYTLDPYGYHSYFISDDDFENTCFTFFEELWDYGKGKTLYGWHISDLVIYDKPRELSEFKRDCDGNCQSCQYAIWQTNGWVYEPYIVDCKPITRPPQSWCYVWERSENGKS